MFMLVSTLIAMVAQCRDFFEKENYLLLSLGCALLVLAVWILVEAALAIRRRDRYDTDEIVLPEG